MDIRELKKLLKNSTSVLILDNGEPAFVVVDYTVYKNAVLEKDAQADEVRIHTAPAPETEHPMEARDSEILDRLNRDILALKNQIEAQERAELEAQS